MQAKRQRVIRFFLPIFLVCVFAPAASAQTLLDKLVILGDSIYDYPEETLNTLNSLEKDCLASNNDTIKALFNSQKGYLCFENKDYLNAIKYFESVPSQYESINIKDRGYIEAFLALGMANQRIGNYDTAERWYRSGLLRTIFAENSEEYRSSFYLNLGHLYKERGDSILASKCYEQVDAKQFGSLMDASADNLIEEGELEAINLRKKGDFEQALIIYDKLIARVKDIIGVTNETYARLIYSKAIVIGFNLNRLEESRPLFKEVISLEPVIGECSDEYLGSLARYLQILAYFGEDDELNRVFNDASTCISRCKSGHFSIGFFYRMIGNGAYWNKHYELAIPFYEKYIAENLIEEGNSQYEIPNMLSVAYIQTNQPEKAIPLLRNLLEMDGISAVDDLEITINHNLGRALMLTGNIKEALEFLHKSNSMFRNAHGQDNPRTLQYIQECAE